ncbi:MAG: hypothetical protein HYZ53_12310 [Planctomycetes bacterium]|nr:hypothetical protein [Planctomycetota bacterium]
MNVSAWTLGVLYSLGVLAVKVGVGAGFLRGRALAAAALLYAGLFAAIGLGVERLLRLPLVEGLLAEGTLLHALLSAGLLTWGLVSLFSLERAAPIAPWGLVLPCPVCAAAVLVSTSLGVAATGLPAAMVACALAGFFLAVAAAARAVVVRVRGPAPRAGAIGMALLGVGLYFLVLLLAAPVLAEAARLAAHAPDADAPLPALETAAALGLAGLLVLAGFTARRMERPR